MIVNKDKLFEAEKMNEKLHSLFLAPHFLYSCFVKSEAWSHLSPRAFSVKSLFSPPALPSQIDSHKREMWKSESKAIFRLALERC